MLQMLLIIGIKRLKDQIDMTLEDMLHLKINKDLIRMIIIQKMIIMKRNSVDLSSIIIQRKTVNIWYIIIDE